jgi:hypothetical protein
MWALTLFLFPLAFLGRDASDATEPVIGRIEIDCSEIFDTRREGENFWLFRLANRLHILTREEVVARELLFAPGNPLDREALAQSERNLRALGFLRDARLTAVTESDGTATVRVETWDTWSTQLQVGFSSAGDVVTWEVGAAEKNLLGRGKHLEVLRGSDLDRDSSRLLLRDPRVLGTRVGAELRFSDQSDGRLGAITVGRPFFSLGTSWAFGLEIAGFDQRQPLYRDGEKFTELRHVRRRAGLGVARALVRKGSTAVRAHFGFRREEDEVESDLRRFAVVEGGLSVQQHRYLKLTHVNQFENPEDFNLGHEASALFGLSAGRLGGEEGASVFISLSEQRGFLLGPEHFLVAGASWNARHRRGRLENSLARVRLDYYRKLSPRRLVAASAKFIYGRRLDPEVQLTLGADSGLRGYPVRQFTGDRSLMLTAEKRFFLADDLARLVSLGVASFVDAGFVWPAGESVALSDLRADTGVSFLIGRNRLATRRGVRVSLAYALNELPGRSRWLFSVGSRVGF